MDKEEKGLLPAFQGLSVFLKQQQTLDFCPQLLAAGIAQAAHSSLFTGLSTSHMTQPPQ